MKRFFGMMPSDEIKKEVRYKDHNDLSVTIQAGPHGWTILWADGGSNYKDVDNDTDKNFEEAYNIANEQVGPLKEHMNISKNVACGETHDKVSNSCEAIAMDVD